MKFLSFLAATAVAFFGAAHTHAQTTTAPTTVPVPLPECVPLNITAKKADIASLNAVIDIAVKTDLLKKMLLAFDPISVVNNRLTPLPFSVLGMDFALTPIIKSLNASGLASVVPSHLNITGDNGLGIKALFNGSINVDGTFSFEIAQLNKQWWQICWTSILQPAECPPFAIDVDVGVGLLKPTVAANLTIGMLTCPKTAPKGTCSDVTVSNILIAALNNQLTTLLPRILKKFTAASLDGLNVGVDKVTKLNFHFPTSGPLITALGQKILGYTTDEINKKGSLYNDIIGVINKLGKQLLNQLLTEKLAPQFGKTCY